MVDACDLADELIGRLIAIGFQINTDEPGDDEALAALNQVELVEKHQIHEPATYAVEIGIARMEGNAQVWDTWAGLVIDDLANPDETYLHEKAWEKFQAENKEFPEPIEVSGHWLHSYDVMDDSE